MGTDSSSGNERPSTGDGVGRQTFVALPRAPDMEQLAVASGFDVHDYRSKLKLLRQDGASTTLANRSELACPACGERFERLLVTDDEQVSFGSAPEGPICLVRAPEQLLVLTH